MAQTKETDTKGPLTKGRVRNSISKKSTTAKVKPTTPYDIFDYSIKRAENLIKAHTELHGKKSAPLAYLSDILRASIVLSISALDAFVRTLVVDGINAIIKDTSKKVPDELAKQIQEYLGVKGLFDAARTGDLSSAIDEVFRERFEEKSFQGIKNILDVMRLIGHKDIFKEIAEKASKNEKNLKDDLNEFTRRRHLIAHCGDYDLSTTPPADNSITKKYADDCIRLVKLVAKNINEIHSK